MVTSAVGRRFSCFFADGCFRIAGARFQPPRNIQVAQRAPQRLLGIGDQRAQRGDPKHPQRRIRFAIAFHPLQPEDPAMPRRFCPVPVAAWISPLSPLRIGSQTSRWKANGFQPREANQEPIALFTDSDFRNPEHVESRILCDTFMRFVLLLMVAFPLAAQFGRVTDPQDRAVAGAQVTLKDFGSVKTNGDGSFEFAAAVPPGEYTISAEAPGFESVARQVNLPGAADLKFVRVSAQTTRLVISARNEEAAVDVQNITRDDQLFRRVNGGIDLGQHEGGGKSLEVRRFGFNLDHGGVNGGLKVLLDGVQQNQGTQGHGQGYLGALKSLSPELIQEVTLIDGPFSPEYGDFSGLGVVHIRQRESMPDKYTVHLEGGNFDTGRAFLAFSPDVQRLDAYLAYDGSYTDGPFLNPGRYRRDNINSNYTRTLDEKQKLGFRFIFGRNDFYSSGQLPQDLVSEGLLDRFGDVDPSDGGRVKLGTLSAYYTRIFKNGDTLRVDGFVGRSLFDLYSNFTFFLNDPVNGDAFQQHDSRLQEGANAQYQHAHRLGTAQANFTAGANFHDNQINVGLYSS